MCRLPMIAWHCKILINFLVAQSQNSMMLNLSLIAGCQCQHTNISAPPQTLHGLSCIIQQPRSSNRVTANDQLTQSLASCVRGTSSWATLTKRKAFVRAAGTTHGAPRDRPRTSNPAGRVHSRSRRSITSRSTIQKYRPSF